MVKCVLDHGSKITGNIGSENGFHGGKLWLHFQLGIQDKWSHSCSTK